MPSLASNSTNSAEVTEPKIFSSSPTCLVTVTETFSIAAACVLASAKRASFFFSRTFNWFFRLASLPSLAGTARPRGKR